MCPDLMRRGLGRTPRPGDETVGVRERRTRAHRRAGALYEVIDIIQLHGGESVHYVEKLRS